MEMPHLKRPPSENIRDHICWTTQPMEEPEQRAHLLEAIDWIGWDRLLFATDYPHWDYDDPARAARRRQRRQPRGVLSRQCAEAVRACLA